MGSHSFPNNFYGREKQRDRRHNYAFSGGAPFILPKIYNGKDKSFWYVAYEKYHESYAGGGSPNVTVPLPEWWEGNLSRYLTDQVIGQDALGRDILRGMIYDPETTRIVDGKTVRDPFPGNIIPASRISQVSEPGGCGSPCRRSRTPRAIRANQQRLLPVSTRLVLIEAVVR
jgi:hypothetical protein